MNEREHTRFGKYEKRDQKAWLEFTVEEKQTWDKVFSKDLSGAIRKLLDKQVTQGKLLELPVRPARGLRTRQLLFRCSASELFYWKLIVPAYYGGRSRLPSVICELLNREAKRRLNYTKKKSKPKTNVS